MKNMKGCFVFYKNFSPSSLLRLKAVAIFLRWKRHNASRNMDSFYCPFSVDQSCLSEAPTADNMSRFFGMKVGYICNMIGQCQVDFCLDQKNAIPIA